MRLFTRLIVCAAAAMILSAVLFHIADAWFGDNTSVIGAGRKLLLEARRTEALRARTEMVTRSLDSKRDTIDLLLAGRLNLRQATFEFQKANDLVDNVDIDLIPTYRTPDDPRGVARQVLMWARNTVNAEPSDKNRRLLSKLEREYQTLFAGANPEEAYEAQPMMKNSTGRTETASAIW